MHQRAFSPHMLSTSRKKNSPSILFLGLARNCEKTLPAFFSYMERLENHGLCCAAIIGENGSRDRTRSLIEKARRVDLLDTGFMDEGTNRLARMALGRQALLEFAKQKETAESHICVLDLDDAVLEPPEPRAVDAAIHRLEVDRGLFAVGASSLPVYYDLLSLRNSEHDYSNLYADIQRAKRKPLSYFQFHERCIYRNQRLVPQREPVACSSSFNGFCIYNRADYYQGNYRDQNETQVCEHVSLNLSIARATGKRMVIAPEIFIRAPAGHIPVGFLRFWADRIGEILFDGTITAAFNRQTGNNAGSVINLYRSLLGSAPPEPSSFTQPD